MLELEKLLIKHMNYFKILKNEEIIFKFFKTYRFFPFSLYF